MPFLVVLPLGIALLLNRPFPGRTFFRAVFFAPYVLGVAVVGLLWRLPARPERSAWSTTTSARCDLPDIPLDHRDAVGLDRRSSASPSGGRSGFNAVIYLAGLQDISAELYEAAEVDGASAWQQFRHVTLPGLRPVLLFVADHDDPRLGQHVRAVLPDHPGRARQRDPDRDHVHRRRPGCASTGMGAAAAMSYMLALFADPRQPANFRLFRTERGE